MLGMAWRLPLTHSWVRPYARRDQRGRASPRAGPALRGVKILDAGWGTLSSPGCCFRKARH